MSDEKEMKLVVPKSLMMVIWLKASVLLFNVPFLKPVQEAWAVEFVSVMNSVTINSRPHAPVYVNVVN